MWHYFKMYEAVQNILGRHIGVRDTSGIITLVSDVGVGVGIYYGKMNEIHTLKLHSV